MESNPVDLLFGEMNKLGPGDDAFTRKILNSLSTKKNDLVVDAGCGTGRQTLVLAKELKSKIHAIDSHEPFLKSLKEKAKQEGIDELVETHCMDMANIPEKFTNIDLLWSEGSAYNIGFSKALSIWAKAMNPTGYVVATELTWLKSDIPSPVKKFFELGYPDMKQNEENIHLVEQLGYKVINTVVLPQSAWLDGYYDQLEPKAKLLMNHENEDVREFAQETLQEIEVFKASEGSYGYVFYVLQLT